MLIRLRMFGGLAASAGVNQEVLELPEGATAQDLVQAVEQRHPGTATILPQVSVAVNLETTGLEHQLTEGDEVALLPPVAGGASEQAARITTGVRDTAISIDEVMALVAAPEAGGTVVFVGTVRSQTEGWGEVDQLAYTIYRDMAEPLLRRIAQEAAQRWPLTGVCILHRVGDLPVGEQTVVVAASAPHRGEAFEAARYGIDEVKKRVPVWKQEIGPGTQRWVGLDGAAEGAPTGAAETTSGAAEGAAPGQGRPAQAAAP